MPKMQLVPRLNSMPSQPNITADFMTKVLKVYTRCPGTSGYREPYQGIPSRDNMVHVTASSKSFSATIWMFISLTFRSSLGPGKRFQASQEKMLWGEVHLQMKKN